MDLISDSSTFAFIKLSEGFTLIIGANVKKIPDYLFSGAKIVSIEFEEGSVCESIGDYAFEDCFCITSVEIPESVTSIGDYVFSDCTSLTNITFNGTVAQWNAITKGSNWNYYYVPATEVICSDGTVAI